MKDFVGRAIANFRSAGWFYCDERLNALFMNEKIREVTFMAEMENKADPYAVRIDCNGYKIGYVPRGIIQWRSDKVPGNYNMFFSQCLQAGIKFKGIAYRRLIACNGDSRIPYHGRDQLSEIPPTIVAMTEDSNFNFEKINAEKLMNDFEIKMLVYPIKYKDNNEYFNRGNLYYLPKYDAFCIWGGDKTTGGQIGDVQIRIIEANAEKNEETQTGFVFPKKLQFSETFLNKFDHREEKELLLETDIENQKLIQHFIERYR